MKVLKGLLIGISMYSRLPAPQIEWSRENMRYAMCALPLIGLVIGLILWGWVALADALEIDGFLFGAVYALVPIAVTGGIHMDGLMDTADALGSRADRARKLEILKDSHTGAFAVLTCVLYVGCYMALGAEVRWQPEIVAVVIGGMVLERCLSSIAVASFPCAKDSGLLHAFADVAAKRAVRWFSIALGVCVAALRVAAAPWQGGAMALAAGVVFLYYYWMSKRQFGGITGDLAGYFQQLCEIVMLAAVVLVQKLLEVV